MNVNGRIMMILQAAKEIKDYDVVLVGVGLPNLAANFAKKSYSPHLTLVYESGSIDCFPERQPLSIGDPSLSENVSAIFPIFDTFAYMISGNKIDVGYLGAAQIDTCGRLNTTVIGNYETPKVRLPGSGGACEILFYSKKSVILVEFSDQKLKRELDFITSSPPLKDTKGGTNELLAEVIVTDKCVIVKGEGDPKVSAVYEGTDILELRKIAEKIGLFVPNELYIIKYPSEDEIKMLNEMDPSGIYIR